MMAVNQHVSHLTVSSIKVRLVLSREQPAVAVVHPGEQTGAGAPHTVSCGDVHLRGQEQRGADAEGLLPDGAG